MAYNKKEQKIKSNFTSLRIGLSSPEVILQDQMVRLLNQKPSTTVRISQKWADCSANESSVL